MYIVIYIYIYGCSIIPLLWFNIQVLTTKSIGLIHMCWQKYMVSSYSYSNIQLLVVHSLVAILCHNTKLPLLTCSICFVSIYICVHICIHRYVHSLHLPIYRSCCRVSKIGKMVCVGRVKIIILAWLIMNQLKSGGPENAAACYNRFVCHLFLH